VIRCVELRHGEYVNPSGPSTVSSARSRRTAVVAVISCELYDDAKPWNDEEGTWVEQQELLGPPLGPSCPPRSRADAAASPGMYWPGFPDAPTG
jgi:hypothetical protein